MSLIYKIGFSVTALLVVLSLGPITWISYRTNKSFEQSMHQQMTSFSRVIAQAITPGVASNSKSKVDEILQTLQSASGVLKAQVRMPNGKVFAEWNRANTPKQPDTVLNSELISHYEIPLRTDKKLLSKNKTAGQVLAYFHFSFSNKEQRKRQSTIFQQTLLLALIIIGIGLAMGMGVGILVVKPIARLRRISQEIISTGNLQLELEIKGQDEIGALARSFSAMVQSLRNIILTQQSAASRLMEIVQKIAPIGKIVSKNSEQIKLLVEKTENAICVMQDSLHKVDRSTDILLQNTKQGSESIVSNSQANSEVANMVREMALAIHETSDDVKSMAKSFLESANNIVALQTATQQASNALSHIDISIKKVESNAKYAADLSNRASKDAGEGKYTAHESLVSIEKSEQLSMRASETLEELGQSLSEIDEVLRVISEVARQTNLLALNAAIIASQAGEEGQGFAVVAYEIKVLAEKTQASTGRIAELVRTIQERSEQASASMQANVISVQDGVNISGNLDSSFKQILSSTQGASDIVRSIANSTTEQATSTEKIVKTVENIVQNVHQISEVSSNQTHNAEKMSGAVNHVLNLTDKVQLSAQDQAHDSQRVILAINQISDMINELRDAQNDQTNSTHTVTQEVSHIRELFDQQTQATTQLEDALVALGEQADALQSLMKQFIV